MFIHPRLENNRAETVRYLVRLLAIYHTKTGTITQLAEHIGVSKGAMLNALTNGRLTSPMAQCLSDLKPSIGIKSHWLCVPESINYIKKDSRGLRII